MDEKLTALQTTLQAFSTTALDCVQRIDVIRVENADRDTKHAAAIDALMQEIEASKQENAALRARIAELEAAPPPPPPAPEPPPPPPPPPPEPPPVRSMDEIRTIITEVMAGWTTHVLTPSQMAAWINHFSAPALAALSDAAFRQAVRAMAEEDWTPDGRYKKDPPPPPAPQPPPPPPPPPAPQPPSPPPSPPPPSAPPAGPLVERMIAQMLGENVMNPGAMINTPNWGSRLFSAYTNDQYNGSGRRVFPWAEVLPPHPDVRPWTRRTKNTCVEARFLEAWQKVNGIWVRKLARETSEKWWADTLYGAASYSQMRTVPALKRGKGVAMPAHEMGFDGDRWIWHFYPDEMFDCSGAKSEALAFRIQMRKSLIDPKGADDRDQAILLAHMAADWYGAIGIVGPVVQGRFEPVTNEWQWFHAVNIHVRRGDKVFPGALSADELRANPPPFDVPTSPVLTNVSLPTIAGEAREGKTLNTTTGEWR